MPARRDWLIEARKAKHLTRYQLADSAGISGAYIESIELGKRTPRPDVAAAIGREIGMPESDIWTKLYGEPV